MCRHCAKKLLHRYLSISYLEVTVKRERCDALHGHTVFYIHFKAHVLHDAGAATLNDEIFRGWLASGNTGMLGDDDEGDDDHDDSDVDHSDGDDEKRSIKVLPGWRKLFTKYTVGFRFGTETFAIFLLFLRIVSCVTNTL